MGTKVVAYGVASLFCFIGIFLCCAEEPEPAFTFHFWLSSRFGRCGRASRLFCHFATSISSYRGLLALSSERGVWLPIRHYFVRANRVLYRHLRRWPRFFRR